MQINVNVKYEILAVTARYITVRVTIGNRKEIYKYRRNEKCGLTLGKRRHTQ